MVTTPGLYFGAMASCFRADFVFCFCADPKAVLSRFLGQDVGKLWQDVGKLWQDVGMLSRFKLTDTLKLLRDWLAVHSYLLCNIYRRGRFHIHVWPSMLW